MKRINLITLAFCFLIASCIPSLHPIYDENTMIMDDRILGSWIDEEITSKIEELNIDVSNLTEEYLNELEGEIQSDLSFIGFDEAGLWKFERAANITYERLEKDGDKTSIFLEDRPAKSHDSKLLEQGYTVTEVDLNPYYMLVYKNFKNKVNQTELVKTVLTRIDGEIYIDFQTHPQIQEVTRFSINLIPAHTFAKLELNGEDLYIRSFNSEYIENLIENKRVKLKHEVVDGNIVLTASTKELRAFIEKYGQDEKLYTSKLKLVSI